MTDTLTFTPVEAIPSLPTRQGGEGREPVKWEEKLAPVKSQPDQAFQVWTYEKKSGAASRVSAIRLRLFKATPQDNWTLAVRPLDPSDLDNTQWGVFVQYNGQYTDEEVAQRQKDRDERSAKIVAARAAAQAAPPATEEAAPVAESTEDVSDAPAAAQTPAQKVAAAKAAAKK